MDGYVSNARKEKRRQRRLKEKQLINFGNFELHVFEHQSCPRCKAPITNWACQQKLWNHFLHCKTPVPKWDPKKLKRGDWAQLEVNGKLVKCQITQRTNNRSIPPSLSSFSVACCGKKLTVTPEQLRRPRETIVPFLQ